LKNPFGFSMNPAYSTGSRQVGNCPKQTSNHVGLIGCP
jgi:hypothetical protein